MFDSNLSKTRLFVAEKETKIATERVVQHPPPTLNAELFTTVRK